MCPAMVRTTPQHAVMSKVVIFDSCALSVVMVCHPVLCIPYLCLLWTISVDPLIAFAFLQTFIDILNEYFGNVSAATLKENFDVVYQVCYSFRWHASHSGYLAFGRNSGLWGTSFNNVSKCASRHRSPTIFVIQTPKCGRSEHQCSHKLWLRPWSSRRSIFVPYPVEKGWRAVYQQ